MSKSRTLRSLNCPSCHAPLEVDGTQPLMKCEYCGTMVEVPVIDRDEPKPKPAPRPAPSPRPTYTVTKQPVVRPTTGPSGCTVTLLFLLCIGSFLVGIFYLQARDGVSNPLSDLLPSLVVHGTDAYLLPPESGRDTNQADILATSYQSEKYALAYLDNTTEAVRWESEGYPEYLSLLK